MKNIEIVMIPVRDRQKAKSFYEKLGFKVLIEATDPHGEPWIQLRSPEGGTTISLSSFHGIICETNDIEKQIEVLKAKNIATGKIDVTPWGKFAWLQDLDGNNICLHEKT